MKFPTLDFIFQVNKEIYNKMRESDIILKEQKGFAGLIANVMKPLNDDPQFKEAFKNTHRKILINPTNLNYAALLTIKYGDLIVETIRNKPKSNLKKKLIRWDGYVAMDTQIFLGFATKRLSIIKLGLKILNGEVKVGGILKLLVLLKLIKFLTN
jgi:hypothetical protein